MTFINDTAPLQFTEGDTAFGVEIDEPNWDLTGASAVFRLESLYAPGVGVGPFDGQTATVAQVKAPAKMQYAWPSPLPADKYAAWFVVTFAGGTGVASTERVLIQVDSA